MPYNSFNLSKYYSNNFIHRNPLQRYLVKRFITNITTLINQTNATTVLDIGCGEGIIISKLSNNIPRLKIIGIDLNQKAVEQAKKINPQIKFQIMNATDLKFKDESFDLTLNLEILEHLQNPTAAIKEAKRISKSYCIFSVPNEPWFSVLYLLIGKYITRLGRHPEHVNFWTLNKFHQLIKRYFKQTKVYSSFPWTIVLAIK